MVNNVQLYENIRDSSAAYMVSGRRLTHAKEAVTRLHQGHMQKRTAALCKRSGVIRKRQSEVMQMPGGAHENRQTALKKARRCRANVCHPASLRLTFLQMKNIIISKRAANLRKSSFAARFLFEFDMTLKSVLLISVSPAYMTAHTFFMRKKEGYNKMTESHKMKDMPVN
ncbi:MAG: hypothetical protein ACLT01_03330, partial [Clostridia bacterium]